MMTKKILFLLTFLLTTIGGGNFALAETYELRMGESGNTANRESTNGGAYGDLSYFTVTGSQNTKYTGKYDGVTYAQALKMDSSGKISFTTKSVSTIYVVQCTKKDSEENPIGISLKVGSADAKNYAYNADVVTPLSDDDNNKNVRVYTITNVAAGEECQISKPSSGGESGIFYVKVVEAQASINTVTLTSSLGTDLTNDEMSIVGTQKDFTVTVDATHNVSNATVSYSGSKYNVNFSAGVLTISAKADQTYGTETITVNVPAEGGYPAGSATLKVTYWTGDISNEYSEANVGRKWTFNHAWTNSGLFYDHASDCGWTQSGNHFVYDRITSNAETAQVCDTYVEQMYGLKVKQDAAQKVWMQSVNDTYYLAIQYRGAIVIPNVPSGKTVRVNAYSFNVDGKMFINGQENTVAKDVASDFTYTTSSPGDVEITTSSGETIYFNSIVIEGSSTGDETVQSAPYTWDFTAGSTWGNTAHQVSNVYSDWNGEGTYYHTDTGSGVKGYVIDAIKGLRFQNISWLGLDWGYGHLWMTGTDAKITIPNLKANQVVTFVMEGREGKVGDGTSSSVSASNTDKSSSISIPRTDGEWTDYDFKVTLDGSATFTFTHAVSIRKIIIRKVAPTLVWTETSSETLTTDPIVYGNGTTVTHTATASVTDGGTVPAVKYRSGNTEIATVDNTGKVTPRSAGTVNIYAYTEAGDYATKEISYSLTITEGTADFTFVPQEGKVGVGNWIIPRLRFPSIAASAVTKLKVSKVEILDGENVTATYDDDTKIASYFTTGSPGFTIENYDNLKNSWETNTDNPVGVHKVNVKFTGVTEGTKARVTVKFESDGFADATTQYTIEVTAADALNFNWETGTPSEVYIYENTYMPIPHLSGNANGNNHFSNGSVNASEHAYVYEIKQKGNTFRIKWNEKDYMLKEGVPDYYLTDKNNNTTTNAYLFWANSDNEEYPNTLLVYAKEEGTVRLHAKDSQNNQECDYITIHIVKNDLDTQAETAVSANTYPFTWDFTGNNISASDLSGSQYWDEASTGQFYNTALWQNTDFADSDKDDATNDRLPKYFLTGASSDTNGGTLMPFFKGMKVILGNSTYNSKIHKIRVSPNAAAGEAKVYFSGGTHELILPRLGVTSSEPAKYKLYVKVKGAGSNTELAFRRNGADISGASYKGTSQISDTESSIFSVDVDKNDEMSIYVANLHIYWIALSTEAKDVARPAANSKLTCAAASYSYPKALDLSKSAEVNSGVTAYYASDYAFDLDAVATNTEGYAVVLTAITSPVPANTGLVLRKNTTDVSTSCYMIADGENELNYVAPSELGTNYLKATSPSGKPVGSNETIDNETYTNFAMAYAYKMYHDPTNPGSVYTDYLFDRDWSFYKIMGNVNISKQKSYLQIPGNLYVDREGNIVKGASRRVADDNRPSTKPMLDIIFEDEPSGDHNVTGITSVSDRLIDNDAWYTLQGIRVDAPAKGGIYIHNGRKVVIK